MIKNTLLSLGFWQIQIVNMSGLLQFTANAWPSDDVCLQHYEGNIDPTTGALRVVANLEECFYDDFLVNSLTRTTKSWPTITCIYNFFPRYYYYYYIFILLSCAAMIALLNECLCWNLANGWSSFTLAAVVVSLDSLEAVQEGCVERLGYLKGVSDTGLSLWFMF